MRITFAPADMAGCGYYRMIVPGLALAARGHLVHFVSTDRAPAVWDCDVFVMQRQSSVHSLSLVGKLRARGVKVVHEFDDSFHLLPRDNPNFATYRNGSEHTRMMEEICRAADALVVSTPDLAVEYGKFNRRTYVCYNAFDDRQFGRFGGGVVTGGVKRAGEVRIGWAGSDTHAADMDAVRVPLMKVMDEFAAVRVVFVGADMRALFPQRVRGRMEYAGKTCIDRLTGPADVVKEDLMTHRYYELIGRSDFDIGIAPLVSSSFNRMKCLDEYTLIATKRGVVRAKYLHVGDEVWRDGAWKSIDAVEKGAPRIGLRITTKDGYQLSLSKNHRMLVNGDWKCAEDIGIGDEMQLQPEETGVREYVRMPWPADGRISRGGAGEPYGFAHCSEAPMVTITPKWGRLLGAIAGDGGFAAAGNTIHCDGRDQDWIDMLMDDLRSMSLHPTTEEMKTYGGELLRRRCVRFASSHFVRFMVSLGVGFEREGRQPKRIHGVPDVIWRSPKDVMSAWLSGLFEADGSVSKDGVVSFTSKSERLVREVQRLLLILGIESKVYQQMAKAQTGPMRPYWTLVLRRAGADIFRKKIGFCSSHKRARLDTLKGKPHSNSYQSLTWKQRVTGIEEIEIVPVDIQVEGEVFSAAGFVSHNSYLKAVEYGVLGVPCVLSNHGPYRQYVGEAIGYGQVAALAFDKNEWYRWLRELIVSEDFRCELARNNRRYVGERHVMRERVVLWESAFAEVMAG